MFWIGMLCGVLAIIVILLLIKIGMLHHAVDEISVELEEQLGHDTNTLLTISTSDHKMRGLADKLNQELRLLRKERQRFQNGDARLKESITNISHDLRTPLTAICGYLELLEEEEKTANTMRYLDIIRERTEVLKTLTEELFRYSVVTSNCENCHLEKVNLNGAIEESIAAFYAALKERGITPEIMLPEKMVYRTLDRDFLRRIFSNLLTNVLKYSDGDLKISLSEQGEMIYSNRSERLDVIAAEKLFERFYTVESARKSTGLGLSIAKELTEQMGGNIWAMYDEGRISIYLLFGEE